MFKMGGILKLVKMVSFKHF